MNSFLNSLYSRSFAVQDGRDLIGSARGILDYYGGKLSCTYNRFDQDLFRLSLLENIFLLGVSISVPVGAIPEGVQQEIYFQVCQDGSNIPTFNAKQGERLLSPIVRCGPQGTQFLKPVELILPHCAGTDAQELALMLHGTHQSKLILKEEKVGIFFFHFSLKMVQQIINMINR